ncbi:MAG TPA: hypothetical protein VF665_03265 [Longimicrobium sp.]|jgi:hypothetical protein|uniref:hypothetical protein n=1 Tax=Longimicrobium sp. TaxID=2029185 RepID=UPI002ED78877
MASSELIWRSATRVHEWLHGDFPDRLLAVAREAGVMGRADRMEASTLTSTRPRKLKESDVAAALAAERAADRGSVHLSAWGSEPRPWSAFITLFPVDEGTGRVAGISIINLHPPAADWAGERASAALMRAFRAAHSPDDTEFAEIHPWEHLRRLRDGAHRDPLVNSPMLTGATWAAFLGPAHLAEFDLDRLRPVAATAWRHEWVDGDRGLFLFAGPDVGAMETAEGEAEIARLTEALRGALRSP